MARRNTRQAYGEDRDWKEATVKNDRLLPRAVKGTRYMIAPDETPTRSVYPRDRKPRLRAASPQRQRSPEVTHPSVIYPDEPQKNTQAAVKKSSNKSQNLGMFAALAESDESVANKAAPAASRSIAVKTFAQEVAGYTLPVGDPRVDKIEKSVKQIVSTLSTITDVMLLRESVENLLTQPLLSNTTIPRSLFMRFVLERLSPDMLLGLSAITRNRYTSSGYVWNELLSSDVINSAGLREHIRMCRSLLTSFITSRTPTATESQRNEPKSLLSSSLYPVFRDNYAKDLSPLFRLRKLTNEELKHPSISRFSNEFVSHLTHAIGSRSATPCFELFQLAFDTFTSGLFRNVNWQYVAVVGSAPVAAMMSPSPKILAEYVKLRRISRLIHCLPLPGDVKRIIISYCGFDQPVRSLLRDHYWQCFSESDVDVIIMADSIEEGKQRLINTYHAIVSALPPDVQHIVVRTPNSLTISAGYNYRNIQLLLSFCSSPVDFALFVDLDVNAVFYNGSNVFTLPRAVRAFNIRSNFIPPRYLTSRGGRCRLAKYLARGFDVVMMELCNHYPRCDVQLDSNIALHLNKRIWSYGHAGGIPADPTLGYDDAHLPRSSIPAVQSFATRNGYLHSEITAGTVELDSLLADNVTMRNGITSRGLRFRLGDILSSHYSDESRPECCQCGKQFAWDEKNPDRLGLGLCDECMNLNARSSHNGMP